MKKIVIELKGPNLEVILNSDIFITTPEKWDDISSN